jgi:hypothetical protein
MFAKKTKIYNIAMQSYSVAGASDFGSFEVSDLPKGLLVS